MAEAIVGILLNNLESLIKKELSLLWNAKSEMKKLSSTLTTIQAVLVDAETQQITKKAVQDWLNKLKDAAYDANDILDKWATDESLFQQPSNNNNNNNKKVHLSFSSLKNNVKLTKSRNKIAKKIKKIKERFVEIAKEKSDFHLSHEELVDCGSVQNRETSSVPNEPQIYGRDADIENIVKSLVENRDDVVVPVFPILGSGGVGKTTLAQFVYNDERVRKHFVTRIWCCVSDDFDVKSLSRSIIESVTKNSCTLDNLNAIQVHLREQLKGKRFLLVLDDVWNQKQDEWSKFKNSLTFGAKGSSIIMTTRLPIVADISGTAPAYELPILPRDDYLLLFLSYALGMDNQGNPNLAEIGREVVEKCGGLPLAARALGELIMLHTRRKTMGTHSRQ